MGGGLGGKLGTRRGGSEDGVFSELLDLQAVWDFNKIFIVFSIFRLKFSNQLNLVFN